jgi:hypothetical protein
MAIALVIVVLDLLGGGTLQFPILFLIPVGLASWYGGRTWGLSLAVGLPLIRLALWPMWTPPWMFLEAVTNVAIRAVVFLSFSFAVDLAARRTREVRTLRGLLPICMFCKKIRNSQSEWEILEKYIIEHSQASFTHGICPECAKEHFQEHPHPTTMNRKGG